MLNQYEAMLTRRKFLRYLVSTLPLTAGFLSACSKENILVSQTKNVFDNLSLLLPADKHALKLPLGFTSRIIAQSGSKAHVDSDYIWHKAPDGGAIFSTADGGWIYVSNSEVGKKRGGAGAIRFDARGNIISAYSILNNTSQNCAGGATPWGSWLSCEEHDQGIIWECDPYGKNAPRGLPALGVFAHEAVTVDTLTNYLYMTEDKPDGCLYRFIPDGLNTPADNSVDKQNDKFGGPNLNSGTLQVAKIDEKNSTVSWLNIPDPSAKSKPTRFQVPASSTFKGGEGIVFYKNLISFATKRDNRIWTLDTNSHKISVIYDVETHPNPILTGVDNIALSQTGELIVAEDGGDLQIVVITKNNRLLPLAQLVGHDSSEVTGPAFSPDGKRLYFSSQRGETGNSADGVTYEISGPFHL